MNIALSFALSLTLRSQWSRLIFPSIWEAGLVACKYRLPGYKYNQSRCSIEVCFMRPGTNVQVYDFMEIANQPKKKMEYLYSLLNTVY